MYTLSPPQPASSAHTRRCQPAHLLTLSGYPPLEPSLSSPFPPVSPPPPPCHETPGGPDPRAYSLCGHVGAHPLHIRYNRTSPAERMADHAQESVWWDMARHCHTAQAAPGTCACPAHRPRYGPAPPALPPCTPVPCTYRGEGRLVQGGRGRSKGGEKPMGTTAYGGKGSKGRAANGDRPVGAASCRRDHHTMASCQNPPVPPSATGGTSIPPAALHAPTPCPPPAAPRPASSAALVLPSHVGVLPTPEAVQRGDEGGDTMGPPTGCQQGLSPIRTRKSTKKYEKVRIRGEPGITNRYENVRICTNDIFSQKYESVTNPAAKHIHVSACGVALRSSGPEVQEGTEAHTPSVTAWE